MKKITPILIFVIVIMMTGCCLFGNDSKDKENKDDAASKETTEEQSEQKAPAAPETFKLTVYYPDENLEGFEKKTVDVTAIDEQTIVDQLILAGVVPVHTKVNKLENTTKQLRVDFSSDFANIVYNVGSSGEILKIGSVVNTFLEAYNAKEMIITVDGKVLESGHNIYDYPLTFY